MINRKGILIFFLSVLTTHLPGQEYNYRNFNYEDGLTQSYVHTIIQDENGYLWVGTDNGLFRYNGFNFENYPIGDSLADNFIVKGIRDSDGLWFGHKNGRLSYFNGKKFLVFRKPQPDLSSITSFTKGPDNQIWVSSYNDGLLKLSKDSGVVNQFMFKNPVNIFSFDFLDKNELLIGTNTGLLYSKINESGEIEIIHPVLEIPESKVTSIRKMRNKSGFYIATEEDGIFQLTVEGKLFNISKIIASADLNLSGIQNVYEDTHLNLWLSTKGKGHGIIKITSGDSAKIILFNKTNKFATDDVNTIYEDREGNIWSGNYGQGLTLITPKTFSVSRFDNPFTGDNIFSIWCNSQYRWIGTENGLVKMDQTTGKFVKFYTRGSGLPKDSVTSVYSSDGKELWIGTARNGLFRMVVGNEKIYNYPIKNGTLENSITCITGKGGNIWIGTKKGLCHIDLTKDSIKWFSINQGGLPHNHIKCLFLDSADKLWISSQSNTLAYIQDEKIFKIPINTNSGILILGPVTEDTDSRIWVGSNGNGVFMIESDSISNFTTKEGLLSDYCYSLICDDYKNIWIGHKGGLSRIRTTDFSVKPIKYFENVSDSYQFNPQAVCKDQYKKVWFGSDKGLVSYDPSKEYPQFLPPVLSITSIKINDEGRAVTDHLTLPPGNYKIRIEFLGISLKEPELVTYQYKMEGYDQWSEITKNTDITFNNLTEGEYIFTLKASSGDGAVSEKPITINIFIKKPVWKKWWFFPSAFILMFIITFFYIKRREYKLRSENRILEEKVRERTNEIQCQKNEIELQRDMINKKNLNITSSIKYASHIQNAVLPPLEFIDKLLPENFILSIPKDIVSGDFYWLAQKDNKIVIAIADCTGHGVPGAFMSLLGITLLNEIVNVQGITRSDEIVNKLRERVVHSLQQGRKNIPTSDGMDIALCVWDIHQNKIQFTGGMHDIVFIRDKKLEEIKADSFSVCAFTEHSRSFTMKEIECRKGDIFYLFTDGFRDQFGGNFDKKFLRANFYLALLETHNLSMSKQKQILEKKLKDWMKDADQTDDITVMGIRL